MAYKLSIRTYVQIKTFIRYWKTGLEAGFIDFCRKIRFDKANLQNTHFDT